MIYTCLLLASLLFPFCLLSMQLPPTKASYHYLSLLPADLLNQNIVPFLLSTDTLEDAGSIYTFLTAMDHVDKNRCHTCLESFWRNRINDIAIAATFQKAREQCKLFDNCSGLMKLKMVKAYAYQNHMLFADAAFGINFSKSDELFTSFIFQEDQEVFHETEKYKREHYLEDRVRSAAWYKDDTNLNKLRFLLSHGISARGYDSLRYTSAIYNAIEANNYAAVKILRPYINIEMRVRTYGTFDNNFTPLLWAVYRNCKRITRYLLKEGANIHAGEESGQNALLIATQQNSKKVVKMLLKAGIPLDCRTCNNETALDIARRKKYTKIIHWIKKKQRQLNRASNSKQETL